MGHINDSGGASGSPAVFQGEASRQGAGVLTPSPRFPAAAIPPRIEETAGKGICKIHGEAGSQWLGKCILGAHTGAARGRGGALAPSPTFPAAAIPLRIEGTAFAKSMERRDPSGLANALWGHTRGPQGAGWGLGPLTWASRHRRGGLPIRSSEGGRPHMGQEGI